MVVQPDRQKVFMFDVPSDDVILRQIDRNNPDCPFHGFIGNDKAVKRLSRAAYVALQNKYHNCDQNFALLGPASTGKTTLANKFAKLLKLPFAEIHPRAIESPNDIVKKIAAVCETSFFYDSGLNATTSLELMPLIPPGADKNYSREDYFVAPPMVMFIDEVHSLRSSVEQGLLKATERSDAIITTTNGDRLNCKNIIWIIATTDRGLLFDAFDTRFTKIMLELYSASEIAEIIKASNPDWDVDTCDLVARFAGIVPREALQFAREMRAEGEMFPDKTWDEIAKTIADDNSIDEYGMSLQRLTVLRALGQNGATSKDRLCNEVGCKVEELEKFVMPSLLARTTERLALIQVTSRGYCITPTGLEELDKRGIEHIGDKALPFRMQSDS